jgi:hypothetical protein
MHVSSHGLSSPKNVPLPERFAASPERFAVWDQKGTQRPMERSLNLSVFVEG